MTYPRLSKIQERLSLINSLLVPLMAPLRQLRPVIEHVRRKPIRSLIRVSDANGGRDTIASLTIKLDEVGDKPVTYIVYVSAQHSPIRPYQAERIVKRLAKKAKKTEAGDKALILFAPKGATIGAYRFLKRNDVYVARSLSEFLVFVKKYFRKRMEKLVERAEELGYKLRKKGLALVLSFATILRRLGENIDVIAIERIKEALLMRGEEDPRVIMSLIGPPR